MYRGFNLTVPPGSSLMNWLANGISHGVERNWPKSAADLEVLLDNQVIDGDNLMATWFPPVDTHVFISHSHDDVDLAEALAGFLNAKLGLNSFVDYRVWSNAKTLLKSIDDVYSWSDTTKKTYDYPKVNYSSSHVHMMLASALSKMMDRCECIIFLNTPHSIQVADADNPTKQVTGSPWIYHELITSKLLRRTVREGRMPVPALGLEERAHAMDALSIQYEAPVAHLTKLSVNDVERWGNTSLQQDSALNWLYRNYPG